MTKGLKRFYGSHDLHFITCSCYRRPPELGTAHRRDLFLRMLEQARRKYQFVVYGYVVMPEHFHLLMSEPEAGTPSVVMKVVKERFSRLLNRRRRRTGRKSLSGIFPRRPSGRNASTISTCGARASGWRNCAICIVTR